MSRATRSDWLGAGMLLLREGGKDALTIDALCTRMKRTKGSFYHHFSDISDYLDALLEHWEAENTLEPIRIAEREGDPAKRPTRLYEAVSALEVRVEREMQAWALREERARQVKARVDARRVAYLAELRRAAGVPKKRAERLAEIEYAAFLGAQQIFDVTSERGRHDWARLHAILLRALTSSH